MEPSTFSDQDAKEITFPNGNKAQAVTASLGQDVAGILRELKIKQPKAVLLLLGAAYSLDDALKPRLVQLFSRGLARAAITAEALILDGGTRTGVMQLMGQGVADRGRRSVLLGVAPGGMVTYPGGPADGSIPDGAPLDPNHSHFVLAESNAWGGEIETMFALAEALAGGALADEPAEGNASPSSRAVPVVTVLVGGGDGAREETLRSVRQGWPLLVVQGSGGIAGKISRRQRLKDGLSRLRKRLSFLPFKLGFIKPPFIKDEKLAEIIDKGRIHLFPIKNPPGALKDRLKALIPTPTEPETILRRAWDSYSVYDAEAGRHQKAFRLLQFSILLLGVLAVSLALVQTQFFGTDPLAKPDPVNLRYVLYQALRYAIIVAPITISILIAASNQFKAGNKWIMLRAAAETIKREIYRYRTRAGIYRRTETVETSREAKLADQMKTITAQLMKSAVNEAALHPYDGPIPPYAARGDDGLSFLTPSQYITVRLKDQLNFFSTKTGSLEKKLKRLQWGIYIIGGVGTLLAAVGFELWVALTTSLAAVFVTYLEYQQTEYTLVTYNQVATDLENVRGWWLGLSAAEQANPVNQNLLVEQTEAALKDEQKGWIKQMTDALAELQAKQVKEGKEAVAPMAPEEVQKLTAHVEEIQAALAALQAGAADEPEPEPPESEETPKDP